MNLQGLSLAARLLAVSIGAYGAASLALVALSFVMVRLGAARAEAVVGSTLAGFAIFAAASIWAFQARSARRAWAGLTLLAGVSGAVLLVLRP